MSGGNKTKPTGFGGGFSTYNSSGFGALTSKVDVISSAPKLAKPISGITAKPFGSPNEEERNTDDEDDEGSDGDVEERKEDTTTEEKKEVFTEQEGECSRNLIPIFNKDIPGYKWDTLFYKHEPRLYFYFYFYLILTCSSYDWRRK